MGTLYIVATPIGNREDISYRAVQILKDVSLILCEDTRKFGLLKKHYGIETPLSSCFEHNESQKVDSIIEKIESGSDIALVSDAGTPLISDPGFRVVKECRERGIQVSPVPGASACIAALSCCGTETDQFLFMGFLPQKEGKKQNLLKSYLTLNITLVAYESPFRIAKTLKLLSALAPERPIYCAKELTKTHEEVIQGSALEILESLEKGNKIKGEFVVIIGKAPKSLS